jgi:transposase
MRQIGTVDKEFNITRHYDINIITKPNDSDDRDPFISDLSFTFKPKPNTKMTLPGVYCLRTNILNLSDKIIWETYISLTYIENVFKAMKSELGLRPIYHHKEQNIDSQLFVSLLSYQFVTYIRNKLSLKNITFSWSRIVSKLSNHCISTSIYKTPKGKKIIKTPYKPTELQTNIYNDLKISHYPTLMPIIR